MSEQEYVIHFIGNKIGYELLIDWVGNLKGWK
jgi:hypothetical protein